MQSRPISSKWRFLAMTGSFVVAGVILNGNPAQALAQSGGSFGTPASKQLNMPTVSPYLNLAQPGINPGIAYQTLVLPNVQYGNAISNQQQQIQNLQQTVGQAPLQPKSITATTQTGHPTAFLNTSSYFPAFSKGAHK
jgi:hypothetical protein